MRRVCALVAGLLLSAIASAGTATISWDPATDGAAPTGYRLYERCGTAAEISVNLPLTPRSVQRTALPDGVTCYWQMTAYNADGESTRTGQVSKALPPALPLPPTNVVVAFNVTINGQSVQVALVPAFGITAAGTRSSTVYGFVRAGAPCIGDVVFTYRSASYRRVPREHVGWWRTTPNDNVAAPCAAT